MNGSDLPSPGDEPVAATVGPSRLTERVTAAWQVLTTELRGSIPGGVGVGISLLDTPAAGTSVAVTSRLVVAADQAQYRLEEGPCWTAWAECRAVRVDDLRGDGRWPRWAAAALSLSIRSVLSSPLLTAGGRAFGSVKLYSLSAGVFDDRAERLLGEVADTAALLVGELSLPEDGEPSSALLQALGDRAVVQRATGMVMRHYWISAEAASWLLITEARASGRPLQEVARSVLAATGSSSL